jgi:hypothetical protein
MNTNMKEILFVSGFNTHPDEQPDNLDIYESFVQHFKYSKYKITFFRYKREDPLDMVYTHLCERLATNEHKIIMGHSLGGGLLTKYLSEHEETRKVILLMPFITVPKWKQIVVSYFNLTPFALRLPKCIVVPNSSLFEGGNIINDHATMLDLSQVSYAINHLFLIDDDIVNVFQKTSDVIMIYADDETVSPIDSALLDRIEKKVYVKGKHVPFADPYTTKHFFDEFVKLL